MLTTSFQQKEPILLRESNMLGVRKDKLGRGMEEELGVGIGSRWGWGGRRSWGWGRRR